MTTDRSPATPEPRTVRTLDIPLGPGRQTLRLALAEAGNDEPAALVLSVGFGGAETGDPFQRPSWAAHPIRLPASVLPALRAALAQLEDQELDE